ncbi:hypothetical protein NBE98_02835 [Clostridium swellfunianum]|uniref:hypothetical protein n=1 Tax=Clostridium swellfunianum TaxID=1367462 RepID=UPI00202F20C4|nr:hypothetical protein [Clostridium swellfunianum]MCM0647309.1 hypothetical protein [Clostridium swellfunianum]
MKKLSRLIVLIFVVSMLLTGCWKGDISSDTAMNRGGEGTKTITMELLKDNQPKPDGKGNVEDNSQFFKGGFPALAAWLQKNVPEGFKVDVKEEATKYVYSITYSFKDINEYNEKTKKLIGNAKYEELGLKPSTLNEEEAKDSNGKKAYKLTFTESKDVLYASSAWAVEGIFNDTNLFDPDPHKTGAIGMTDIYQLKSIKLKIGDTTKDFDLTKEENASLTEVSLAGFAAKPADKTPLYIGIGAAVIVVIAVLTVIASKKKSK